MLIAVISDTHMPRGGRRLPDACVERIASADLLLHAGDFSTVEVLRELEAIGPPVVGVHGNVDSADLRRLLPEERVVEAEGARIAMVHDAGPRTGRLERMRRRFGDRADVVVFGHSHLPLHEQAPDGFQILNPGSPTERRRAPSHTMGLIRVVRRLSHGVISYPSDTVYGIMTPGELIKDTPRPRHGLSQRELAYRAGTSQSAIARIEGGDEDITWKRLTSILAAMGDQPVLDSERLQSRYDLHDLMRERAMSAEAAAGRARSTSTASDRSSPSPAQRRAPRMPPPDRVFRPDEILRVLAAHGVDFVVIGGLSRSRRTATSALTQDLDVIVRPEPPQPQPAERGLARPGGRASNRAGHSRLGDPNQLRRAPHHSRS